MLGGVAQGGLLFPALFILYVNDIHALSHHVELALYADDTATTSRPRSQRCLSAT